MDVGPWGQIPATISHRIVFPFRLHERSFFFAVTQFQNFTPNLKFASLGGGKGLKEPFLLQQKRNLCQMPSVQLLLFLPSRRKQCEKAFSCPKKC